MLRQIIIYVRLRKFGIFNCVIRKLSNIKNSKINWFNPKLSSFSIIWNNINWVSKNLRTRVINASLKYSSGNETPTKKWRNVSFEKPLGYIWNNDINNHLHSVTNDPSDSNWLSVLRHLPNATLVLVPLPLYSIDVVRADLIINQEKKKKKKKKKRRRRKRKEVNVYEWFSPWGELKNRPSVNGLALIYFALYVRTYGNVICYLRGEK